MNVANQMQSLLDGIRNQLRLKSDVFFYFSNKIITTKNSSNIIIKKENSLFVINTTTFLLSFDKPKGKTPDIFKCIHNHHIKRLTFVQRFYSSFTAHQLLRKSCQFPIFHSKNIINYKSIKKSLLKIKNTSKTISKAYKSIKKIIEKNNFIFIRIN